uniref:Uncharacterized protein n=1 Tax=Burkholderia phage vB_BgluM-SURPRISE13 TaxID=3159457 RepID=A0AAU7PFA0_9VIRU
MGLVGTLREIEKTSPEELNRYNPNRPVMIDGSLSELVTQALNVAYTKKDMTSGEPYYGHQNATGEPPPGAGNVPNILTPDTPRQDPNMVKPSLEGMQQMTEGPIAAAAYVLEEAINVHDGAEHRVGVDPMLVYAIPEDNRVPEEMNSNIEMYGDSGAVDPSNFVFVYTDKSDTVGDLDFRCVDLTQKVKDYEGKGAKVYQSLESFLADYNNLRRK